ncbi:MAG: Uma2 family endonuclease [Candidatus Binatia bacterium]
MPNAAYDIFQRHRLTVAEYYRMGETGILAPDVRVELIEGEVIDRPPIGSPHAGTVKYIGNKFAEVVRGKAIVSIQDPLFLDLHSEPHDIALLRPRPDFYRSAHPTPADVLLLIEVADTSLAYDTQIKVPLYTTWKVSRETNLPWR